LDSSCADKEIIYVNKSIVIFFIVIKS